jgi:predicted small secreted protein
MEDFEEVIDQKTGERVLKLTAVAAAKKGLTDLCDVAFEVYVDPLTGKEQIRIKGGNQTGKLDDDQKFEIFIDKKTGQQKIVLKRPQERTRRNRFGFYSLIFFFSSSNRKIH